MTDKARDLLERALRDLDLNNRPHSTYLAEEIRAYLAEPEQDSLENDETWEKGFRQGIKFAKVRYGVCKLEPEVKREAAFNAMKKECPYTGDILRGAFYDGWLKAEKHHQIHGGGDE